MAFVNKSALAAGSTTALPVYASAVAGNLLVALVEANQATNAAFTITGSTAGWTRRAGVSAVTNSSSRAEIWDKLAIGSDTMPTWNGGTSLMTCQIAEFSGTTAFDQKGTAVGTTGPTTVTASGTDGGTGRLIVALLATRSTIAYTQTNTDNVNSLGVGTGINILGDNGVTSQVGHHRSIYVTTAVTGSVADNDAMTWTPTTATTHAALCIASYATSAGASLTLNVGGGSVNQIQVGPVVPSGSPFAWLLASSTPGTCLVFIGSNIAGSTFTAPFTPGWILAKAVTQASLARIEVWIYPNNPGGITTVNFNSTLPGTQWLSNTSEWENVSASGALDTSGFATATAGTTLAPTTSGNVLTAGDLAISAWTQDIVSAAATYTTPVNFTRLIDNGATVSALHFDAEYMVAPSTGATLGPTLTSTATTVSAAGVIVCLKPTNPLVNQSAKLQYGSATMKLNTFDFALIDPGAVPSLGDLVSVNTPTWVGLVSSVQQADIVNRASGHQLVTVTAVNQAPLGSGAAPFNLKDNPSGSDAGYSGLSIRSTANSDGSVSVLGSCRIQKTGLLPGMNFNLTSANLGITAVNYQIVNVTTTWIGLAIPTYLVEFGNPILTLATAGGGVLTNASGLPLASIQRGVAMGGGTLGYTTTPTTTAGVAAVLTDLTNLSVTVTVGGTVARRLRITGQCSCAGSVADGQYVLAIRDAANVQSGSDIRPFAVATTNIKLLAVAVLVVAPGTYTYKLSGIHNNGTGTLTYNNNGDAYIMVEDAGT